LAVAAALANDATRYDLPVNLGRFSRPRLWI
jgi:hypothetical protein